MDLQLQLCFCNVLFLFRLIFLDELLEKHKDFLAQMYVGGSCDIDVCEIFDLVRFKRGEGLLYLLFYFGQFATEFATNDHSAFLEIFTLYFIYLVDHIGQILIIADLD